MNIFQQTILDHNETNDVMGIINWIQLESGKPLTHNSFVDIEFNDVGKFIDVDLKSQSQLLLPESKSFKITLSQQSWNNLPVEGHSKLASAVLSEFIINNMIESINNANKPTASSLMSGIATVASTLRCAIDNSSNISIIVPKDYQFKVEEYYVYDKHKVYVVDGIDNPMVINGQCLIGVFQEPVIFHGIDSQTNAHVMNVGVTCGCFINTLHTMDKPLIVEVV